MLIRRCSYITNKPFSTKRVSSVLTSAVALMGKRVQLIWFPVRFHQSYLPKNMFFQYEPVKTTSQTCQPSTKQDGKNLEHPEISVGGAALILLPWIFRALCMSSASSVRLSSNLRGSTIHFYFQGRINDSARWVTYYFDYCRKLP